MKPRFPLFLALAAALSFLVPGEAFSQEKVQKKLKVASVDREAMQSMFRPDPGWILRDEEGREIEAVLLSAHGDIVKIQRTEDKKEFDVPISTFDAATEERIRAWIDEDPDAVDFSIELSATRELVDSTDFEIANRSLTTSKWAYRVKLSNVTRNELVDADVEYRIIYDDNVDFLRTTPAPGDGKAQQDGQSVDLPNLQFNDEIEFLTPPIEAHTYEYSSTRGDRDFLKDDIKGIWVRVVRHGEVIAEYQSNEGAMSSYSWDNEEEGEIKILNRFRDSFDSEETE